MEMNLQEIRSQLDQIDDQMTALFAKRMNLVTEVAAYKKEKGLPIWSGTPNCSTRPFLT